MFGPNTYTEFPSQISYSHRDKQFIETYESVKESFIHKFNLQKYDIMFIGGSVIIKVFFITAYIRTFQTLK